MDVLVLIDKLDDLVHNSKPVPLTDQVRVDKEEIYDILDQMRATIPEEIKQARWIVKERQEMLAEAKREAELLSRAADDVEAGGPCWEALAGHERDPIGSVLALRFVAAVHRLVLRGAVPALAQHYPSAGGEAGGDAWPDFRAAVAAHALS